MERRIGAMRGHMGLCGWGRVGQAIARRASGADMVVVDASLAMGAVAFFVVAAAGALWRARPSRAVRWARSNPWRFAVMPAITCAVVALVLSVATGGDIDGVLSGLWHGGVVHALTAIAGTCSNFRNPAIRSDLVVHAAVSYSLVRPPRTDFRRIRSAGTGNGIMFGLSSGARKAHVVPLVAATSVVVPDVLRQGRVQVSFAHDEHPVGAFRADGAYEPLGNGVHAGSLGSGE